MNSAQTIHALFEEQVRQHPDSIAIDSAKGTLSYQALNEQANQLAHYLENMHIAFDTPIALCMERSEEFLITLLAILKLGCPYLPIDFMHPEERLHFILEDSQTPLLVTHKNLANKFSQFKGRILCIDSEAADIRKQAVSNLDLMIPANNLAYIIYTSGSTGTPKGVLIEHSSAINYALWFADYCPCYAEQRIDFSSNPNFDMAITVSIAPLLLGMTVVICPEATKKDLRLYINYLNSYRIDTIKITPSYFKVFVSELNHHFIDLPYLKTIILGGEQLTAAECDSWLKLYPKQTLINEYGPTETTVAVSIYKIEAQDLPNLSTNVPIGYCGRNMYAYILDENLQRLPDGAIGELYLGGACLARGYLNRPELTQKQFIMDPFSDIPNARLYKTGDLCYRLDNQVLEYLGRIDNQVKIRGFRIELEEIEQHLAKHPKIATAVVVAQKDSTNEQRLFAYYIKKEQSPSRSELIEYLNKILPPYMIPEAFIELNTLPLTANGKLDKNALPIPEFNASQTYVATKTPLEKEIAAIWAKELHVINPGLEDDFFELGGHSLSAARIVSEINAKYKKNIGIYEFYQASNIRKLIALIHKAEDIEEAQEFSDINDSDIPLSEFQFMLWMMNTFEPETKKLNITARKRFKGCINQKAFEFALRAVTQKQEALNYQIFTFRPSQHVQKQTLLHFYEEHISHLSPQKTEERLEKSLDELTGFYPWPKDAPLFLVRLFYLNNNTSELQICLSHMISDDLCPEILLADLSDYYLLYDQKQDDEKVEPNLHYKKYIQEEQHYYQKHLERDMQFWEAYLKDTKLFSFPSDYIVTNMKSLDSKYSTYTEIPEQGLTNLKHFCAKNHISINDGLCAAMALALSKYNDNEQQNIFMNRVKSTREKQSYDDTIGCFLRLEPIKISMNKQSTLSDLSKQIHQSSIETSLYQRCPGLVKLTATENFQIKQSKIKDFLLKMSSSLYASLFRVAPIHLKIFQQCTAPLASFDPKNNYLININVHSNFMEDHQNQRTFFGLDAININNPQYDLLNIDNCFDVCFMRNDAQNKPYLVISANLQPEFRARVAQDLINALASSA